MVVLRISVLTVVLVMAVFSYPGQAVDRIIIKNVSQQTTKAIDWVDENRCRGFGLPSLMELLPIEGGWDPVSGIGILRYQGRWCKFLPGFNRVILNGQYVILPSAPCLMKGYIAVPYEFITMVATPLLGGDLTWDEEAALLVYQPFVARLTNDMKGQAKSVIVIDPAHGGNDPGIELGEGLSEKTATLTLAEYIKRYLTDEQDCGVRLTRDTDYDLDWRQRAAQGNVEGVTLYVSIHGYAGDEPEIRVYLTSPALGEQVSLHEGGLLRWGEKRAGAIEDEQVLVTELVGAVKKKIGDCFVSVYSPPIVQLQYVAAPAIAIEVPFNSPALRNEIDQLKLASAIASALRILCKEE